MYIYYILNLLTGKLYVGQTKRTLEKRLKAHLYEAAAKKYNMYLHNSIRKYGKENFTITLIEECSKEEVYEKERYWIRKMNTLQPNGYNEHEGGKGGCLNPSPELREKLRRAKLGKPTWNKGLNKNDPRVKLNGEKIKDALKGRPKTEEHRKALKAGWAMRKMKREVFIN